MATVIVEPTEGGAFCKMQDDSALPDFVKFPMLSGLSAQEIKEILLANGWRVTSEGPSQIWLWDLQD